MTADYSTIDIQALLTKYWGYSVFRPLQEDIIRSVLTGHDTLALLPTGGGKSLCYQLPALAMEGVCLVISPLIALMKDQVQQLSNRGIKAACLVSGMTSREQEVVLNGCLFGRIKLLYVSPERLKQNLFLGHLRQMKVSFVAVDEAHCISQWGYDFRPPYLEIAAIRALHPCVPFMALTATATPEVVQDIQDKLAMRSCALFQTSFARPNLAYRVIPETDKYGRLLRILQSVPGCAIVYVRNRRRTQQVSEYLTANQIGSTFYHAGLSSQERDQRQRLWMDNKIRVMVATNAFGMGIDKPDVRLVAHLDVPSSIEAYFQEAGRAGRDEKRSYAALLFDENDLTQIQKHVDEQFPNLNYVRNVYRGVCNFYQIPVGGGQDRSYDFDLERLCQTYNFSIVECYNALKILEREGLLLLPTREEVESRLMVVVDKEELYRFQVEHKRFGDLLQLLLRLYGGLFVDFVPINERQLARRCYTDEESVEKMLAQMDAMGVVSYKRRSVHPQICFSSPRIEAECMTFDDMNYRLLKNAEQKRVEAMTNYVQSQGYCRSQLLLSYFGESQSPLCGLCDHCLDIKSQQEHSVKQCVVQALLARPLTIQQLLAELSVSPEFSIFNENYLVQIVRLMLDRRELTMDSQYRLSVQ